MGRKILFRLDDICPDMNYDNFNRIKGIFRKYDVVPIIGVIPCNKNEELKEFRKNGEFISDKLIWEEIKHLQDYEGWEIALHGFDHISLTSDGGIMKRNRKSEFAGVSKDIQDQKIREGLYILKAHGLNSELFMAPFHSFDDATLSVLKNRGIHYITDGMGLIPYKKCGIIFFPVPQALVRQLPFGCYTICLHPNTMTDVQFKKIEYFIHKHRYEIISYKEAVRTYIDGADQHLLLKMLVNETINHILNMVNGIRQIIRR